MINTNRWSVGAAVAALSVSLNAAAGVAQTPASGAQPASRPVLPVAAAGTSAPTTAPAASVAPADYIIGPDDVLSIVFWKDKDMTTDVVVRPDGKISLPVLNEVQASGLTPEQLRESVTTVATKFFEEPSVNVVVKQINSRKVSIMGEVAKPGQYALSGRMTVLQLIALAGGPTEYAKKNRISVIRIDTDKQSRFPVNYEDVVEGKNLKQNIDLKAGDVVVVP